MKLEIIIDQAITNLLKEKLILDYWFKNFDAEIVNLRQIYRKDYNTSEITNYKYLEINNIQNFIKHINSSDYDYTIIFLAYPFVKIFEILTSSKRNIYIIQKDYLPIRTLGNSFFEILPKIITNFNIFGFKRLYRQFFYKNKINKNNIKGLCLFGGTDGIKQYKHFIGNNTKILQSYSTDAENFKIFKNKKNISKKSKNKIAIFIDQAIPVHPDFLENNLSIKEEDYYKNLNNFFSYLEEIYEYEVIIMGHPRIKYKTNPFNSRKILYGKTLEYSFIADLIITFSSTAISYGILLRKNILLLSTYKLLMKNHYIKSFQSYLNCQVINISKKKFPKIINNVDYDRYEQYEKLFIGNYKAHQSMWVPLISELKKYNHN